MYKYRGLSDDNFLMKIWRSGWFIILNLEFTFSSQISQNMWNSDSVDGAFISICFASKCWSFYSIWIQSVLYIVRTYILPNWHGSHNKLLSFLGGRNTFVYINGSCKGSRLHLKLIFDILITPFKRNNTPKLSQFV